MVGRTFLIMALICLAALAAACAGTESEPDAERGLPTRPGPTSTSAPTRTPTPLPTATIPATASPTAEPATSTPTSSPGQTPPAQVATPPPAPSPTSRPSAVTLRFTAIDDKNFDRKAVRVAAGTSVTAIMDNVDTGVAHNLSFSLPGLAHGETCSGPCTTTQVFTASTPGSYFFLCTIHDMTGSFTVDP